MFLAPQTGHRSTVPALCKGAQTFVLLRGFRWRTVLVQIRVVALANVAMMGLPPCASASAAHVSGLSDHHPGERSPVQQGVSGGGRRLHPQPPFWKSKLSLTPAVAPAEAGETTVTVG